MFEANKEEQDKIKEIYSLTRRHNESSMEFYRKDSLVILNENQDPAQLDSSKLREFISLEKKLLEIVQSRILRKI